MDKQQIAEVRQEITERLAPFFAELEQAHCARLSKAAHLDPEAHKMTRVFDHGAQYRYYSGTPGKYQKVIFCYSVHRNAAGYFMGWREVYMKNGVVKRDRWLARRRKTACIEIAKRRATSPAASKPQEEK